jgi:hypothetical protein
LETIEDPEDCIKKWRFYNVKARQLYEYYNDLLMDALQTYGLSTPKKELDEGLF